MNLWPSELETIHFGVTPWKIRRNCPNPPKSEIRMFFLEYFFKTVSSCTRGVPVSSLHLYRFSTSRESGFPTVLIKMFSEFQIWGISLPMKSPKSEIRMLLDFPGVHPKWMVSLSEHPRIISRMIFN